MERKTERQSHLVGSEEGQKVSQKQSHVEKTPAFQERKRKKNPPPGPNARQSHPLHRTWANMIQRCTNPNNTSYHRYGGRGIKVCKRWRNFLLFIEDVGVKPTPNHTLERKNNDKGYCPENVRWATFKEQHSNREDSRFLTLGSKCLSLPEWSALTGLPQHCIRSRLKRGWSEIEALCIPKMK